MQPGTAPDRALSAAPPAPARGGVTWRSVLLGLLLIPPNCIWVTQVEIVHYSGHPTCLSIFSNAVFSLLLLIFANLFLLRFRPQWALTQGELLTAYIMTCLGCSIAAHDMMQMLVPEIACGYWMATPENGWADLIQPHLAPWLTVSDHHALQGYHEGHASLYDPANYGPWVVPMLWWGGFIVALVFAMQCLNSIMRKQWTENEKLTYPLTQLPVEMTQRGGASGLYRSRALWGGFAFGAGLDLWNGIAFLVPSLPLLNVKLHDLSPRFLTPPWNAIGWTPLSYYPFIVALSFFLPTDVSFSCWFFYLFRKALQVIAAATGWGQLPDAPFLIQQSWGSWMAFVAIALWSARPHLRAVWRTTWGRGELDEGREAVPYRWAMLGLAGSLGFILYFWLRTGASAGVILLYFALYFALALAMSKMRAEIGPPTHELGGMATTHILVQMLGSKSLGAQNLIMFMWLWFNNRMVRSHQAPIQLEALKMAERGRIELPRLFGAMVLAVVVGVISGFWALLGDAYGSKGARGVGFAMETHSQLEQWLRNPQGPRPLAIAFMGIGAGVTFLLGAARMRFLNWPLHPAGYALGMVFGLDYVWFPILMAWAIKTLVLRYGSPRLYGRMIPFACGVILGEFVVGSAWSSLSVVLEKPMYTFWIF